MKRKVAILDEDKEGFWPPGHPSIPSPAAAGSDELPAGPFSPAAAGAAQQIPPTWWPPGQLVGGLDRGLE